MNTLEDWRKKFPDKFVPEETAFQCIHQGDTIFIGSACAEPQYLVQGLIRYVKSNPKAFFDAEVLQHPDPRRGSLCRRKSSSSNFRHNSFFIGDNTREAVNAGAGRLHADLSLRRFRACSYHGLGQIDVALIQTSPPDTSRLHEPRASAWTS
ncbi:MAG: hypothetical protein MZV70_11705 [Desulfobacterales bacterium]|nr:hypothetical protein [Desulfobacterales bacterium]